jgi:hypothetical protein
MGMSREEPFFYNFGLNYHLRDRKFSDSFQVTKLINRDSKPKVENKKAM